MILTLTDWTFLLEENIGLEEEFELDGTESGLAVDGPLTDTDCCGDPSTTRLNPSQMSDGNSN